MKYISISLTGSEEQRPEFRDIVEFLWDFNLLYETSRLIVDPRYESFRFTHYIYTRHGRPLRKDDLLQLVELRHESPLKVTTIVGATAAAAAALWAVVQTVQTVEHWPLEDQKLVAEVRKTELEARKTELEVEKLEDERIVRRRAVAKPEPPKSIQTSEEKTVVARPSSRELRAVERESVPELNEFRNQVQVRGATEEMSSIIRRFERSPVKIEEVDIKIVSEDSK